MVSALPSHTSRQSTVANLSSHVCLKRRWMPKFEAEPTDPKEAERLQRRRKRRLMCACTLLQQAGPNV